MCQIKGKICAIKLFKHNEPIQNKENVKLYIFLQLLTGQQVLPSAWKVFTISIFE